MNECFYFRLQQIWCGINIVVFNDSGREEVPWLLIMLWSPLAGSSCLIGCWKWCRIYIIWTWRKISWKTINNSGTNNISLWPLLTCTVQADSCSLGPTACLMSCRKASLSLKQGILTSDTKLARFEYFWCDDRTGGIEGPLAIVATTLPTFQTSFSPHDVA